MTALAESHQSSAPAKDDDDGDRRREEAFLEHSRQRAAAAASSSSKNNKSSRQQAITNFWSDLRIWIQAWRARVDGAAAINSSDATSSAQQHQEFRAELEAVRTVCFGRTSASVTTEARNELSVSPAPDAFTRTDWRLLQEEFEAQKQFLQGKFQLTDDDNKFTFRRYRQAVAALEADGKVLPKNNLQSIALTAGLNQHLLTSSAEKVSKDDAGVGDIGRNATDQSSAPVHPAAVNMPEEANHQDNSGTLESISNQSIFVQRDGAVKADTLTRQSSLEVQPQPRILSSALLMLKALSGCQITIHKTFQAIHLVDLKDCTIRLEAALPGSPLHMTHCQNTKLCIETPNIQQVRMHTSQNCTFHLPHGVGAMILEGCQKMTIHCSLPLDCKDFDWLRPNQPSPNVSILPYQAEVAVTCSILPESDASKSGRPVEDEVRPGGLADRKEESESESEDEL